MKINSISHAEKVLQKYVPNVAKFIGDGMSLDRMEQLLEVIGHPQNNLKVVHIAGTSGKTSTSYYISAFLQNSGKKVALTVSPHINSVTERIQINGHPMSDKLFCEDLSIFLALIENKNLEPSYFELLIGFVFWCANKYKVDYLVLETGMGGLLDATNVVSRRDKICVITDIGFDHTHILGKTLHEIAGQKAGIIQQNNSVFMYNQSPEIMQEINKRIKQKNATLHYFDQDKILNKSSLKLNEIADFQIRNWLLAEQTCNFIAKRDKFKLISPNTSSVNVPGRIEKLTIDKNTLIMDGAHNQQKMQTFVDSFKKLYPNTKASILLALKEGKEYKSVIGELKDICSDLIVTTFNTTQDLPAVSQNPKQILNYAIKIGIKAELIENNAEAFDHLMAGKSSIKIITGSFYLISQIRKTTFYY